MSTIPAINTFVGDLSPNIGFAITRNGLPVDLTGATVYFKIFDPKLVEQTNITNQVCIIDDDPTSGKCVYVWVDSDKPDPNIYTAFVQVIFPVGRPETSQVRISVKKVGI